MTPLIADKVHYLPDTLDTGPLPQRLNYPLYYEVHPLAHQAAMLLQEYLTHQTDFVHNFGLERDQEGMVIGKMFGVLVVKDVKGRLGYLAAFSGKLANSNHHDYFVPPVFDTLSQESVYLQGQPHITQLTEEIERREGDPEITRLDMLHAQALLDSEGEVQQAKAVIKSNKQKRSTLRSECSTDDLPALMERLKNESIDEQLALRRLQRSWKSKIEDILSERQALIDVIDDLKQKRKTLSFNLQKWLFENYTFINQSGAYRSLWEIFPPEQGIVPPAGAGECAAPKLFQYAFHHQLQPLTFAEFWWGQSPPGEVRVHQQYYPACRSKCAPILKHMLEGTPVDPNPMAFEPDPDKKISILYRDDDLAIINKPHELLSVPGKLIQSCVFTQAQLMFPEATGPLIVHRLDMSTSGIMIIPLHHRAYKYIQKQFLRKTIKKTYLALLERDITSQHGMNGTIDLPLRVDLDDRPRQMVCYDHGKPSTTQYEVIEVSSGKTRIKFSPITGRTHQLRVHAAHHLGLNAPIVGDDLYGTKGDRLHLHAAQITFRHPTSFEVVTFEAECPF